MNQSISTICDIKIHLYIDCSTCERFSSKSFKEANSKLDDMLSKWLVEWNIESFVEVIYTDGVKHSYTCYDVKSLKMLLASYDTFYSIYRLIGKKKGN